MPRAQQQATLVLQPATAQALYPSVVERGEQGVPLSPEIVEMLPAAARRAIRKALDRGGVEGYLVEREGALVVVLRNRR